MKPRTFLRIEAAAWLADARLGQCAPGTRGIWLEARLYMAHSGDARLEGSTEGLARLLRCSVAQLNIALPELAAAGLGSIKHGQGKASIADAELAAELLAMKEARRAATKRQARSRRNSLVPR